MKSPLRLLLCLPVLPLTASSFESAEPSPAPVALNKLLSPEEFQQTGLYKLSETELTTLASTLGQRRETPYLAPGMAQPAIATLIQATPRPKVATKSEGERFGAEQVEQVRPVVTEKELHSKIEGTLESVTGRSVFLLENGQVWQQRIPETIYFSPRLQNPSVIITRGLVGYKMLIVEADRFIYVKRIK